MLVQIHASGFKLDAAFREQIEQKVSTSLSRFADRFRKVDVHLADVNGPKGGTDKSIRLVVDSNREPTVIIEEKGEAWIVLLDSVTERAEHNVRKQINKTNSRADRTSMSGDRDVLSAGTSIDDLQQR